MRYDSKEQLNEIISRSDRLRRRKERRIVRGLTASVLSLMCLLLMCIGRFAARGPTVDKSSQYGSFLLSTEAGGYVLVAVIASALGVIVTVAIYKHKNKTKRKNGTDYKEFD